jgi:signal transduction histidine kinase
VRRIGKGNIPEPRVAALDDLLSGRLDAQWVEVSGVVRRAKSTPDGLELEVNLQNGAGRIFAYAHGRDRAVVVDSTVRLRGVCYYQFNKARQAIRPYLSIPEGETIVLKEVPAANLEALPIRSVESLLQFNAVESYAHRVRVRGVVIYAQSGEGFWIRDTAHGLRVFCDDKKVVPVGTEVDVFGFLNRGEYGPVLEDAVFRETGKTSRVIAVQLAKAREAFNHDSDLVACEAVILEQWTALDGCRLKLSDGETEFPAALRVTNGEPLPSQWLPGARVRIAGVCSVGFLTRKTTPGTLEPQSFQILLRSPADVVILQRAPWWTAQRVAWLMAVMAATLLLVVGIVVWLGRRRLHEQAIARAKSEAEFAAVWNERNRMARELHDTLAQGLGAISLHLEVAKRRLPADSSSRQALEDAGSQTRASLDEVRNAIWNMRSQVLEAGDLGSALNGVLHSLTDRNHVIAELRVDGKSRRFAPVVENNLLRIGQEAIANAVRHGSARRIEVVLKFAEQQFEMTVTDDGRGFDPAHPPASEGGFGLMGMHERAAEVNGKLCVTSAAEKGTVIKVTLPLSNL